jgi:hypothetical protein
MAVSPPFATPGEASAAARRELRRRVQARAASNAAAARERGGATKLHPG